MPGFPRFSTRSHGLPSVRLPDSNFGMLPSQNRRGAYIPTDWGEMHIECSKVNDESSLLANSRQTDGSVGEATTTPLSREARIQPHQ